MRTTCVFQRVGLSMLCDPLNLAKPLVQAAIAGVTYEPIYGLPFAEVGPAPSTASFSEILWSSGVDANGEPVDSIENGFSSGIQENFAFFGFEGMEDGLPMTRVWYLDGQPAVQSTDPWEEGSSGIYNVSLFSNEGPLSDGEFAVEIFLGEKLALSGNTTIGGGTTTAPAMPTDGVAVSGTVTDVNTGRVISGAGIIWLIPGLGVDDWQSSEEDIWDSAQTDINGIYIMTTC